MRQGTTFACVLALGWLLATPSLAAATNSADPRIEAAVRVYRADGASKALPAFQALAVELERSPRTADLATTLHYLGECHWRLGHFQEARRLLDRALSLEHGAGDGLAEGRTLNVRGLLSWDEGDYEPAVADFRRAGALARAAGDAKLEGSSLNNLGLVYDEQGDYDRSLQQYQRALVLYRDADFPRGVGDTLGNIGGVHLLLGQYRQALGYYRQALAISEQLKSTTSLSQDHGNVGLCLLGMGEVAAAVIHFDRAIALATQSGMRTDRAYWLRAKGDGLVATGRYDLALNSYRAALATYQDIGARADLAETLHADGELHLLLGDSASAEFDFKRALDIARSIGLDRAITANLISLGDLEFRHGQSDAASHLYDQARWRSAAVKVQPTLAKTLLRLARVHRAQPRNAAASMETEQALAIARSIGAPALEAEALHSRAEIRRVDGRFADALVDYQAAERSASRVGDPDLLWRIYLGRARAQEASGDPRAALASLEAAVALIEGVRGRLREMRFRSGYLDDKFEVYHELMRLQLRQGNPADAFSTAERLRARSFIEQLGGRAAAPLSVGDRRVEIELRERVRQLQQSVGATSDDGSPAYAERAIDRFSRELARAEHEYQTFLDDHAGAGLAVDATVRASTIQQRLAPNEALIEYVVGPEGLLTFVLTSRTLAVETSPSHEFDLMARIALLRDLISQPRDERWRKPAARLGNELFGALARQSSLDNVDHLYIVPHGALTYLPFALLPRPGSTGELLVDRYTLAYLPAASALLHGSPRPGTNRTLLAVAPSRGHLRHAADEARAIDALFRPDARSLIGRDATEARFKQLAGGYRMLHLATHGYFNEMNPLLSGLELEADRVDDGMLRVHEILDLRLQAELVTLSACDTALGSGYFTELPRGDDFIGLNRAFLAAGSASVLATLWQVDDQASVAFMQQFYEGLRNSATARDVAGALARAQRDARRSPLRSHPYYWAAYIVVGSVATRFGAGPGSQGRTS